MFIEKQVAVLLSTFNGSKYISAQLDSLIKQSYSNWIVYVRDDGSTDDTVEILKSYAEKYDNIVWIQDEIKHRGIRGSFMYLLDTTNADFYMFCDQDDIWLENKIEISVASIIEASNYIPALIATDLKLVDKNLYIISDSMWKFCNMEHKISNLKYLEVRDYLTGCTMCFNKSAKEEILKLNRLISNDYLHDQLATLAILKANGWIKTIDKSTILYRQHDNNVMGGVKIKNKLRYRLKNLKELINKEKERFFIVHRLLKTSIFRYLYLRIRSID